MTDAVEAATAAAHPNSVDELKAKIVELQSTIDDQKTDRIRLLADMEVCVLLMCPL